jgi:transposase
MTTSTHSPPAALPVDPRGSAINIAATRNIGVGIDTARYGHYAAFLRDDLRPAAAELAFTENAKGYAQLRTRLDAIKAQGGPVHFHIRLDAAGQYADNLLHFLHKLADPTQPGTLAPDCSFSISCGDPQRNKNYRAAFFGNQKSDPVEARAAARYAVNERPKPLSPQPDPMRQLRQVASRLQAVARQRTRLINQLHLLLVHSFPELAALIKDIAVGWILELIERYPTAPLLAAAADSDLEDIAYVPEGKIALLKEAAQRSIASLTSDIQEQLIRDQVRQIRDANARQKRLESLLIAVYKSLPERNHLDTIKGLGEVTAAILTAFIRDIGRFEKPSSLVKYFGILPIEVSSGTERDGTPRGPYRYVMSKWGNDLVRRYLWMAAMSAAVHNPAVRPLYLRVVAKHPDEASIAIGHAMRKLLHLVFAIWKSGKPFDPKHYPWDQATHTPGGKRRAEVTANNQAAGHTESALPAEKVVTATCSESIPDTMLPVTTKSESNDVPEAPINFAHIKRQLPLSRVLDHLGIAPRLRGNGPQKRCACPIHRGDGRGRTFSVNLEKHVFHCHQCSAEGDVIDLWAALHKQQLREAALDLVRTFNLEPAPRI